MSLSGKIPNQYISMQATVPSAHIGVLAQDISVDTVGSYNSALGYNALNNKIQGEMLVVENHFTDDYVKGVSEDGIKSMMALQLAKEMLARGQIEFTKQQDPISMKVTVRARCFCVPNDEVQILRKNGY